MNTELSKFSIWFTADKLLLNKSKTKFSIFLPTSKKKVIPIKFPVLEIDETHIARDTAT